MARCRTERNAIRGWHREDVVLYVTGYNLDRFLQESGMMVCTKERHVRIGYDLSHQETSTQVVRFWRVNSDDPELLYLAGGSERCISWAARAKW